MAMDFPNTPTVGSTFTSGSYHWIWDGQKWNSSATGTPVTQFLPLAGGTMGGQIVLVGDATASLNPVTLQQLVGGYLALAGGTLTGPLILAGDATAPLNPVTLQQLQAGYVPVSGGTIGGNLVINGTILSTSTGASGQFRMTSSNTSTGYGSFWRNDGTLTSLLLTNNNDALGTFNGLRPITVTDSNGEVAFGSAIHLTGGTDTQSTSFSNFTKSRWRFAITAGDEPSAGAVDYRGFDSTALGIVGAGTAVGSRTVHIYDLLVVDSNITNPFGRLVTGGFQLTGSSGSRAFTAYNGAYTGNYCQIFDDGNGHIECNTALYINQNTGQPTNFGGGLVTVGGSMTVNANLNLYGGTFYNAFSNGWLYFNGSLKVYDFQSANNVNAAGSLYCGGCQLYNSGGWLTTPQPFQSSSSIYAAGEVSAGNAVHVGGNNTGTYWQYNGGYMYCPNSLLIGGNINCHEIQLNGNNLDGVNICYVSQGAIGGYGSVQYGWANGNWVGFQATDALYAYNNQSLAGGVYWTYCDERMKWNFGSVTRDCLTAINAIELQSFDFSEGAPRQRRLNPQETNPELFRWEILPRIVKHIEAGFTAQQMREIIPEAIPDPLEEDAYLSVDLRPVVATLIGAVQQLTKRVASLEGELKSATIDRMT
jgi:hypothetical protein